MMSIMFQIISRRSVFSDYLVNWSRCHPTRKAASKRCNSIDDCMSLRGYVCSVCPALGCVLIHCCSNYITPSSISCGWLLMNGVHRPRRKLSGISRCWQDNRNGAVDELCDWCCLFRTKSALIATFFTAMYTLLSIVRKFSSMRMKWSFCHKITTTVRHPEGLLTHQSGWSFSPHPAQVGSFRPWTPEYADLCLYIRCLWPSFIHVRTLRMIW